MFKENPQLIMNFVDAEKSFFKGLLNDEKRQQLAIQQVKIQDTYNQLDKTREGLIFSEEFLDHYADIACKPKFYLETNEINLAAYLFGKKMQIFAYTGVGEERAILPVEKDLFAHNSNANEYSTTVNENAPGEVITIYHQGAHFSRCTTTEGPPIVYKQSWSLLSPGLGSWLTYKISKICSCMCCIFPWANSGNDRSE